MKKLPLSEDNPDGSYWETDEGVKICVHDLLKNSSGFKRVIIEELLREHAFMQQIPEPSEKVMVAQDAEIERLKGEVKKWKDKYYEMRRHCRSANKGAERNAVMSRLLSHDCHRLQARIEELLTR